MNFDPQKILVIDFGQLGDVVLSLPALGAVRNRFPRARITVAVGKPGVAVVEMSGCADVVEGVDRVALRDGPKPMSIWRIAQFVRAVRRERYDFVIDLHSLSETNLLGFLSGAPHRLFARRPGRSLDFLSKFHARPPVEDARKHAVDRYLDVLAPLGVGEVSRVPRLRTRAEDHAAVDEMLRKAKARAEGPVVGLFPGAGHPSRRWPVERFAELARRLESNDAVGSVLFAGPEERLLVRESRGLFPRSTVVLDRLTLPQLAAMQERLAVFVSNDTGPMHVAAAVGTPVVILMQHHPMFDCYIPPGDRHKVVHAPTIEGISVEEAYAAARAALTAERMAPLFSS